MVESFLLMSLETINKRMDIIGELQDELKRLKVLYDETLEDDPKYQEYQEEASKVKEEVKTKKNKIISAENYQRFETQLRELRQDLKENKEALSQELADYYKDSGSLEIVDSEGNTKRIVFTAKLISS